MGKILGIIFRGFIAFLPLGGVYAVFRGTKGGGILRIIKLILAFLPLFGLLFGFNWVINGKNV